MCSVVLVLVRTLAAAFWMSWRCQTVFLGRRDKRPTLLKMIAWKNFFLILSAHKTWYSCFLFEMVKSSFCYGLDITSEAQFNLKTNICKFVFVLIALELRSVTFILMLPNINFKKIWREFICVEPFTFSHNWWVRWNIHLVKEPSKLECPVLILWAKTLRKYLLTTAKL